MNQESERKFLINGRSRHLEKVCGRLQKIQYSMLKRSTEENLQVTSFVDYACKSQLA